MAKQTRSARRARREAEAAGSPPAGRPPRARNGGADGGAAPSRPSTPEGRRGSFVAESIAELKKVEWPGQPQLVQGTAVVLIACVIVGVFLWLADLAFKPFVQNILLGQ